MKGKVKGKIIALASLALASLMAFTTAVTAAAFFNYELHQQEIVIDMGYGKYFAGGNGTVETPYLIGNSEHLRNLSKLTAMGVLGKDDYFQLSQDITYAGEPLLPIGTFHSPFYSQFDGKDHTITNLVVEATDQLDVGMFGHTDVGSSVKNFKLDAPKITANRSVGNEGKFDYATLDNNVLRAHVSEDFCKSFFLYPTDLVEKNKYTHTFKTFGIKYSINDINGNPMLPETFKLNYSISDPMLIEQANVVLPQEVAPTANENVIGFKLNEAALDKTKFALIDFYIEGLVKDGEIYRFARYSVERFKIYGVVNEDGTKELIQDDVNGNDWKRVIYPKADKVDLGGGNFEYDYIEHRPYVGIVAGNVEGNIDRILVRNPKMVINGGPFASNSYLIGNHIDDNRKSPVSKHNADFDNLPNELKFTYKNINSLDSGFKNVEDAFIYDSYSSGGKRTATNNKVVSEIYGGPGLLNNDAKDAIRLYGTNNKGAKQQKVKKVKSEYNTIYPHDQTPKKRTAIRISGDMSGELAWYRDSFIEGIFVNPSCSAMKVSNALQFWATATTTNKDFWDRLTSLKKKKFIVNIELDYAYFDNNYGVSPAPTYEEENKLVMLAAKKNALKNTTGFVSGKGVYAVPTSYPNKPAMGALIPMDNVGSRSGTYAASAPKCDYGYVNLDKGKYPLRFHSGEIAAKTPSANQQVAIQTKIINLEVNMPETGTLIETGTHTPLFLLGMKTGTNNAAYNLDIFGLRVMISDISGNFGATLLNVDFTDDITQSIPATEKFQETSSKVRVKTTVFDDKDTTNAGLKVNPAAVNGCGTYIITATTSGSTQKNITIKYNASNEMVNAKLIPTNSESGFAKATIRRDQNLTV